MTLGRLARLITLARRSVTSTRGQLAHFLAGLSLLIVFPLVGCVDDASDGEKYTKPTVNAGSDQAHTLPVERLTLSGSAKTYPDYLYSIKTTHWRQVSGPQQLVLLNEDELTAMALNPTAAGTYEFELYAKDSLGRTNTDRVTVVLREVAAQQRAASTQGYADDFDVMWTSVTEHYGQYEVIQDQWQQIYQLFAQSQCDRIRDTMGAAIDRSSGAGAGRDGGMAEFGNQGRESYDKRYCDAAYLKCSEWAAT
ncbi:hypothetical protein N779_05180 [Vibrio coralliilyticus OCN008]|nr:hypothetical protein N779_05180 [Vibrio coralliilyticus OCN008]